MARRGLTLIELIVVTAIVALLLGLSLPALVRVRNQAQSTVCLQNTRTLALAWLLYKDANDDFIVGGGVDGPVDWVKGPSGTGTVLDKKKEGIRRGALFPYVGGSVDVYSCPADERKRTPGVPVAFRSYSIAGGANGELWQTTYVPAVKYSDIGRPAERYIFVEEADPRGWNKGSWVLDPLSGLWVDPLAIWHSRSRSTLAYADGHSEIHPWVDKSTIEMSRKQEFYYPVPEDEGQDLRFMIAGFPQKTDSGGRVSP